jgi:uncharacterized protein with PIN domain
MQIRLYLDEDAMARSLTRELRARGVDVATAISERLLGDADSVQLEFATAQGRVIYTYNVSDYARLHADYLVEGKRHAGIILVHQSRFTLGEQIRRTLRLVATLSAEEMHDRVEYLSSWG